MATAGPNSAGTGADDAIVGTITWSNPSNLTASDNSRASASIGDTATSHYLKATNFGFSIPGGATINGIQVEYECHESSSGGGSTIVDNSIKIVKGGTISGDEKSNSAIWPHLDFSEAYISKGGAADLWGVSWTASDINASNFGVVISCKPRPGFEASDAVGLIDHVRITITYTPASGGAKLQQVGTKQMHNSFLLGQQ